MEKKIITLGLVALMLLVILLGVTYVYAQGSGSGPGPGAGPRWGEKHRWGSSEPGKGLNLTPEQKASFREIRRKFIQENAQLIGALVAKRLELRSLWTDPKADSPAILAKEKELRDLQNQMRDKVIQAKLEARKILTPEQIGNWKPWRMRHRGMMGHAPRRGCGFGNDKAHLDLGSDAAQESFVLHPGGVQVGELDDEEIQGGLDLLSASGTGPGMGLAWSNEY
jgi:Spy/CpxP family protein refolding chaperone